MKSTIQKLLWAVFTALLVASCGPMTKVIAPQKYNKAVTAPGVKPLHIGKVTPTRHEIYHVQVYKHSVVFMSTTKLTDPSCVEIFDIDFDGSFDVVFMHQKGSLDIGTTEQFKYVYTVKVPLTLSDEDVEWWIFQSTDVRRKVRGEEPKIARKTSKPSVPKKPEPAQKETPATKPTEVKPSSTPPPVETSKKEEPQQITKTVEQPEATGYDGSTIHLKKTQFFDASE